MSDSRKDFLRKLELIQQAGQHALLGMPPGLPEQHVRLMISLAKYLVTEVELCSARRG